MKKKYRYIILIVIACFLVIIPKKVKALTREQYETRNVCGNTPYELAKALSNLDAQSVGCYATFAEAHNAMENLESDNLIVFERKNNQTTIVDAKYALLDLTINQQEYTYYFADEKDETRPNNYMDNGSAYGAVDGAFLSVNQPNKVAHVKVAGYDGWINPEDYEIVPLTWVKSSSSYTVTNDYIRHNYVAKIQNTYTKSNGSTIGPKPPMLSPGTYYSYDGIYFYQSQLDMLKDYKSGARSRSVNSTNPYYNYYMYLPNHSKTSYSSVNIDSYIRDGLGYTKEVYGNTAKSGTSRLYGKGTFFYYAQQKYGVNAILALSLSRNETGNGQSDLAIFKNNGFGLNAVDANPYQAANWYANFATSILDYASKWITYGYSRPFDDRYRGSNYGNKGIGMNIKYASDPYWGEKMAAHYYSFDKYYGLQDYNYYQLGIANTTGVPVYKKNNTASGVRYYLNYASSPVIITEELVGESVLGNNKWYKIVSDLNIDQEANELYAYTDYNWESAYLYVPACYIDKINTGKNNLISPSSVTAFQDSKYSYDLYVEQATLKPKVAKTKKDAAYYYDASLTQKTGKKVLSGKYLMVYTAAYNSQQKVVAYLVTSNYLYDQKQWVSADSIQFVESDYAKETVNLDGQYAWVNSTSIDSLDTVIGGQYDMSYYPVLEQKNVNGTTWLKVPVNLEGNNNSYGYILKTDKNAFATIFHSDKNKDDEVANIDSNPTINAQDQTIYKGEKFDALKGVSATDKEDGDLTEEIKIKSNNVNPNQVGVYKVIYQVSDKAGNQVEKQITVTVLENEDPVFHIEDQEITINHSYDPYQNVMVTDKEDGNLTSSLQVVQNDVNTEKLGSYKVVYQVTTKQNQIFQKTITVQVVEDKAPEITATDHKITINTKFNPLENATAYDKEDGDITHLIVVSKNTVREEELGSYEVTYQVTDSASHLVEKTITVEVVEKALTKREGEFYLEELTWNDKKQQPHISGYLKILGINNQKEEEIKYELILVNKKDENLKYSVPLDRMLENFPFDLGKVKGIDYTYSWFTKDLDLSNIPQGDYSLYVKASTKEDYAYRQLVNLYNIDIDRRGEDGKKGYSFKVNLKLKSKSIDLSIRDGSLITTSVPNSYRNMNNNYDLIEFQGNSLHLRGTSYNYGGTYKDKTQIKRTIYFENEETYQRYEYDLGATNQGSYGVTSTDGKSKEYVWYDQKIDIEKLPKGTYVLFVYTKTIDSEDYGEIVDVFESAGGIYQVIAGKKYEVVLNKKMGNRIELVVS